MIGVFSDEGVSGTADLDKRTGLLAALAALSKDVVLLVAKRDRIGRDVLLIKTVERMVRGGPGKLDRLLRWIPDSRKKGIRRYGKEKESFPVVQGEGRG